MPEGLQALHSAHICTFANAMMVLSATAVPSPTALILVQVPDGYLLGAAHMGVPANGMLDAFSSLDLQQSQRCMHPWQHQQQRQEAGVTTRLAASLPRRAATAGLHWEQHRRQRSASARSEMGMPCWKPDVLCKTGGHFEHKAVGVGAESHAIS